MLLVTCGRLSSWQEFYWSLHSHGQAHGFRVKSLPILLCACALTQSASRMMLNLPALPDSCSRSCGGCGLKSSITTSVSTEPAPHRCSRGFIVNALPTVPTYDYHGLVHRAGALFDESEFTGDENAIVDFKYSASPRITWWFDHHLSAFLTPQDHENFLACQKDPVCGSRKFFDPDYTSCTSFLAHIGSTKFGFNTAPVAELIHWANIVDGALYESPEAAVEMAAPAMKLTLIIESTQDPEFIPRLIPLLTEMPLSRGAGAAVCGVAAAAAAGAAPGGHRADPQPQRRDAMGQSSSTSPTGRWRDTTSSSPTICIRRRRTRSGFRSRASGRRCRWARIRGRRPIRRRW